MAAPALPDEILEDIFLRLPGAADLASASAAWTGFLRVARGRRFLRRFLSAHPPPPVLGLLVGRLSTEGGRGLQRAEPPHPAAPAARAAAGAGDFAFSFLSRAPAGDPYVSWLVCDARDGRVLLSRRRSTAGDGTGTTFLDLVVCDPLHRRYVQIPAIPDGAAPQERPYSADKTAMDSEPIIAPAGEAEKTGDGDEDDLRFRVIYNRRCSSNRIISAFVFSSGAGEWRRAASLNLRRPQQRLIEDSKLLVRHFVRGRFYWARHGIDQMIVLDPREMKFSVVALLGFPYGAGFGHVGGLAVVDAAEEDEEDRLGFAALRSGRVLDFYSKSWQDIVVAGTEEWQLDRSMALPETGQAPYYRYDISGVAEGRYLLLLRIPINFVDSHQRLMQVEYLTLDMKTFMVERICASSEVYIHHLGGASLYASFPPPLALPRI